MVANEVEYDLRSAFARRRVRIAQHMQHIAVAGLLGGAFLGRAEKTPHFLGDGLGGACLLRRFTSEAYFTAIGMRRTMKAVSALTR